MSSRSHARATHNRGSARTCGSGNRSSQPATELRRPALNHSVQDSAMSSAARSASPAATWWATASPMAPVAVDHAAARRCRLGTMVGSARASS